MRVTCEIEEIDLPGTETDTDVPSIRATCGRCGHETESYGTTDRSVARCLVLMREECPYNETNFYVPDAD